MKRIFLFLVVLWSTFSAHAVMQFLRWYVDQDEDPIPWTLAIINVLENGEFKGESLRITGKINEDDWRQPTIGTNYQLFDAESTVLEKWQGAAYSFQLELWNEDEDGFYVAATGPAVSYEALSKTAIADYGDATPYQWMALGPAPVPEPTGGVLVLLGAALLGLRRKKAVA